MRTFDSLASNFGPKSEIVAFAFFRLFRLDELRTIFSELKNNSNVFGEDLVLRIRRAEEALTGSWRELILSRSSQNLFGECFLKKFEEGDTTYVEDFLAESCYKSDALRSWLFESWIIDESCALTWEAKLVLSEHCCNLRSILSNYHRTFIEPYLTSAMNFRMESHRIDWVSLCGDERKIFFDFSDLVNRSTNQRLIESMNLNPALTVIDIGTGSGSFKHMLEAFGSRSVTTLDCIEESADITASFFDTKYFDELSRKRTFDVVYLNWIIHDWSDEDAIAILKNASKLLGDSGKMFVIEQLQPEKGLRPNSTLDLIVYLHTRGQERSLKEYRQVFGIAGLQLTNVTTGLGNRDLMELVK